MPLFVYTVRCPYPNCSHRVKVTGARNAQLAEKQHAVLCPMGKWAVETSVEMLSCRHTGCNHRVWSRRGQIADAQERRALHERYCQFRKQRTGT